MKQFFNNIIDSFKMGDNGFSGRKCTAFLVVMVAMFAHVKWILSCYHNNDFALLPEVLTIDYGFVLTLFGLTTWQGISQKKITADENKPASPVTVNNIKT